MEAPEPRAALELSEPPEYGGGSPEAFKDEDPKENTVGPPTADGREKVVVGAAGKGRGTEAGAAAVEASSFCGA